VEEKRPALQIDGDKSLGIVVGSKDNLMEERRKGS
jgi:hypothetical protein